MDIYEIMLKDLKKGKTLFVDVKHKDSRYDRYRIVTPKSCEWDILKPEQFTTWAERSCFISDKYYEDLTPEYIIKKMKRYDMSLGFKINYVIIE